MKKKIEYEETPWEDVDIGDIEIIEDFLPPPEIMRHATVNIIHSQPDGLLVKLSKRDMQVLEKKARYSGVSPQRLAKSVLHAFVQDSRTH